MGQEQIQQIAQRLGMSESQAADAVAQALPEVVDNVSPEGKLPPARTSTPRSTTCRRPRPSNSPF